MFASSKRGPDTFRTCRRGWLRVKLHLLVERDEQGMKDFRVFLAAVGSQREISLVDLVDAAAGFCETTRPKDGHTLTGDEIDGMTTVFLFLVVPFWQWRKLRRASRSLGEMFTEM